MLHRFISLSAEWAVQVLIQITALFYNISVEKDEITAVSTIQ